MSAQGGVAAGNEVVDQARVGGLQPNRSRVSALDDGMSRANRRPMRPNRSGGTEATGTPRTPPIASASDLMVSPSSATACRTVPGAASSSAVRNSAAASSRLTAGHRWVPSPTTGHARFLRGGDERRAETVCRPALVHRARQPHDTGPDALGGQVQHRVGSAAARPPPDRRWCRGPPRWRRGPASSA